jgi:UDP-N-acetylglucosamine acyltransferase
MTSNIHRTAVIDEGAKIHPSAIIGPYCVIGGSVEIGANVRLESHVCIAGITQIGEGTHIFPFASIGHAPQDLKFKGEKSRLIIGKNNKIREHVTINPGTESGGMLTQIGNNCLFMMSSHIAHDCIVGNNVILANNATLAGHVEVGDNVIIGGLSAIHQFVRVGAHAVVGGMSGIESDVIPYGNAYGERASLKGLNLVGLKRKGLDKDEVNALRNAFKTLFENEGNFSDRVEKTNEEFKNSPAVQEIIEFIKADSSRALCQPKSQVA